jgi:hypothetical protein
MGGGWYGWAVVVALGGWLAATVRFHVPIADNLELRRKDLFGLVPDWRFFAPTPAKLDYHVLYRDRLVDGTMSDWTELQFGRPRRWYCFVWNPYRRDRKGMFDLVTEMARIIRDDGEEYLNASVAYLTFLTYVSGLPRMPGSVITQFCVMASDPRRLDREPEPLIVSDSHWL